MREFESLYFRMKEERLIYLGKVKSKILKDKFDEYYDKYKEKAKDKGYESNEIKIIKERGKALFYAVIEIEK